jgi:2',3'-cyclic-nucleotide 2'-phosphodiesterase (5'-nucleotidase family)
MVVERLKREGRPFLFVDAGDALFKAVTLPQGTAKDKEMAKADLIVSCMGGLGYDAMAVGERDLVGGYEALVEKAKAAKLPLFSANLSKNGKPAFEPRRIFNVGGVKVGVFGLSMAPPATPDTGLSRSDPKDAAKEQVAALKKEGADLIIALAHLDNVESTDLLRLVEGIDFVINAHSGRVAPPQATGNGYLLFAGERGREMMRVDLDLTGQGKFTDLQQIEEAKTRVTFLTKQIKTLKDRAKLEPQNAQTLAQTMTQMEKQKADTEKLAETKPDGRTLRQTIITLDPSMDSEERYKRRVDAFVAKYGPTN